MFLSQSLQITLKFFILEGRRGVVIWNCDHLTVKKRFGSIMPELEASVCLLVLLGKAQLFPILTLPAVFAGAFHSRYRNASDLWLLHDGFVMSCNYDMGTIHTNTISVAI